MRHSLLGLSVIAMAACGSDPDSLRRVAGWDSAGVSIREYPVSSVPRAVLSSPQMSIGVADGDARYVLTRVAGGLLLSDGRIAVADGLSSRIRVYDRLGEHLADWGGAGQGPGEFGVLWTMLRYRGDSIVAAEPGGRRPTVLGPDGIVGRLQIGQWSPEPSSDHLSLEACCRLAGVLPSGALLLASPDQVPARLSGAGQAWVQVARLAPDGSHTVLAVLPGGEYREAPGRPSGSTDLHFGVTVVASGDAQGFAATDGRSYSLRRFDEGGVLRAIVRVLRPRAALSDELRARTSSHFDSLQVRAGAAAEASGLTWLAERPFPDSLPAYNTLVRDADDRLWAGYQPTGVGEALPWFDVFLADGTPMATVELEEGMRLLDARERTVLVAARDALGVERVHQYSLEWQ